MYESNLTSEEFFRSSLMLMKKKILRLKSINQTAKRGKLSLPSLKTKFEETSKLLEAITLIIKGLDYTVEASAYQAETLNNVGILVSQGNINLDDEAYDKAIMTLITLAYRPEDLSQ